ncbi:MAG TPA: hypothetical protein VEL07_13300 [Planctomycetota bacterium]|nr:hypothetical protein [Planctomycetota bacterium]
MDVAAIGALKLDLTNHGVRLGDDLVAGGFALAFAGDGGNPGAEGLDLILPGDWWVNVSVAPGYARTSPYTLTLAYEHLVLRHRARGDIPVRVPDTVRFRQMRTHTGHSCGDIGAVHGEWLVVAPIGMRDQLGLDRPRRFLGLPAVRALTKTQWSIDEVVFCAEQAWRLAGVRMVHLEAGTLLKDDGGVADLAPYIAAIRRALPVMVSVTALPPSDPTATLALYAAGCDAISYHLLAWDEPAAARVAPIRSRFVPHERFLAALTAAARAFPSGAVSTDLLLGLEPIERAHAALGELCRMGVVPNCTVFRPLAGAEDDAPDGDMLPTEPILALMAERMRLLRAHDLWHTRVRGFPRTLSGLDRYRPRWSDRWYAALRRRWRISDDAEAA